MNTKKLSISMFVLNFLIISLKSTAAEQTPSLIEPITTQAAFDKIVLNSKSLVAVKITAEQCGYCALMAPIFERLAQKFNSQMTFAEIPADKFNAEEAVALGKVLQVTGLPTLICYKNGQEISRLPGYPLTSNGPLSPKLFEEHLENHFQTLL
jgi:thiol-disulfide isomerase/thioredoxin